jgi:hypothetical protein
MVQKVVGSHVCLCRVVWAPGLRALSDFSPFYSAALQLLSCLSPLLCLCPLRPRVPQHLMQRTKRTMTPSSLLPFSWF